MAQPPTLRRTPQQARSRDTVLTILVAAARVLLQHGPTRLSTNRVAKVAGVSVGSLYQYFSGKADLIEQLAERRLEVMSLEHCTRVYRAETLEESFAVSADVAVDVAVLELALSSLTPAFEPALSDSCQAILQSCLAPTRGEYRADKLELVGVLGASMVARAVAESPGEWQQSEGLRKGLRQLFERHLIAPRARDSGVCASVPMAQAG
jgi:AcrR family transcriptional regulator